MKHPEGQPRPFLLAVTGLSPRIVTETVYALAPAPPRRSFVPTEVQLITTRKGAERAKRFLRHPESDWFHRLRADCVLPSIAFDPGHIQVLEDANGEPLGGIRTPDDNTPAPDAITDVVRSLTGDGEAALHVSIAGGTRPWRLYLGYALSLYGREQDRLSHVLLSPPYESHLQFFGPTTTSQVIHTADRASGGATVLMSPPAQSGSGRRSRTTRPHDGWQPCRASNPGRRCGSMAHRTWTADRDGSHTPWPNT